MRIVINKKEYEKARWNVVDNIGDLEFVSEETLAQILSEISGGEDVKVYNDDELMSTWYVKGVVGVEKKDSIVTVKLEVSILDKNTEKELKKGIDDGEDAIIELAGIVSEMEETIDKHAEKIEKVIKDTSKMNEDVNSVRNKVEAIPSDVLERFGALWTNYNALADRVAKLENK